MAEYLLACTWRSKTTARRDWAVAAVSISPGWESWLAIGYALYNSIPELAYERDYLVPMARNVEGRLDCFLPRPASHANYMATLRLATVQRTRSSSGLSQ